MKSEQTNGKDPKETGVTILKEPADWLLGGRWWMVGGGRMCQHHCLATAGCRHFINCRWHFSSNSPTSSFANFVVVLCLLLFLRKGEERVSLVRDPFGPLLLSLFSRRVLAVFPVTTEGPVNRRGKLLFINCLCRTRGNTLQRESTTPLSFE